MKLNKDFDGLTDSEIVEKLSENEAKFATVIKLKHKGVSYKAFIKMDFLTYSKAYGLLMNTKFNSKNGKNAGISVDIDLMGAGNKVLIWGWYAGDEAIKNKAKLRSKAAQKLGAWIVELSADEEEEEEEKKS